MKYIFIISVLASVLLQSVTRTVILVHFNLNRDYISKNLCEKKKIKNNKCNGSCHLKKELKKSDESETKVPSLLQDKSEAITYCDCLFPRIINPEGFRLSERPVSILSVPNPFRPSIFHPPSATVFHS